MIDSADLEKLLKSLEVEKDEGSDFCSDPSFSEDQKIIKEDKKEIIKEFSVDILTQRMKDFLKNEKIIPVKYERPYMSVGEICGCIRKAYYQRKEYAIDWDKQFIYPYLYLINPVGNTLHNAIQSLFPFDEVEKTIISENFVTKGRVDAIFDQEVVEIKTVKESDFEEIEYKEDHFKQGCVYCYMLKHEYNFDVDTLDILYIARSCQKMKVVKLKPDYDLAKNILDRGPILKKCLTQNIVPNILGSNEELCKYCEYKKYCKKDTKENEKPVESKKYTGFLL